MAWTNDGRTTQRVIPGCTSDYAYTRSGKLMLNRCVAVISGRGHRRICRLSRQPGMLVCRMHASRDGEAREWAEAEADADEAKNEGQ